MKCATRTDPLFIPSLEDEAPTLQRRLVPFLIKLGDRLNLYATRWNHRRRLRRSLLEMDSAWVEKDIGVPLGYLSEEARKPFWRE